MALAAILFLLYGLLVFTYGSDVIGVTNLIHEQTAKNAQRFADAFRLRKEP